MIAIWAMLFLVSSAAALYIAAAMLAVGTIEMKFVTLFILAILIGVCYIPRSKSSPAAR
jgi:hypothetical protein